MNNENKRKVRMSFKATTSRLHFTSDAGYRQRQQASSEPPRSRLKFRPHEQDSSQSSSGQKWETGANRRYKSPRTGGSIKKQQGSALIEDKINDEVENSDNDGLRKANIDRKIAKRGVQEGLQRRKQYLKGADPRKSKKEMKQKNKRLYREAKERLYELRHDGKRAPSAVRRERREARKAKRAAWQQQSKQWAKRNLARAIGEKPANAVGWLASLLLRKTVGLIKFAAMFIAAPLLGVLAVFALVGGAIALVFSMLAANVVIILSSYTATDAQIEQASREATRLEATLEKQIYDIPSSWEWGHIDEFNFDIDPIGHDPIELMGYLNVRYPGFEQFSVVMAEVERLHNTRYRLTLDEVVEIRYREVSYTDPVTGEEETELEAYRYYILNVTLRAKDLENIIYNSLINLENGDLWEWYKVLIETQGARQEFASPFAGAWRDSVTSLYGYRLDPLGGGNLQLHRGIDIAMPRGTPVLAGLDGRVTYAGSDQIFGNFIIIEDDKGRMVKYAHCDRVLLGQGEEVKAGQPIATVGNTGQSAGTHLHIETKKDGEYLNPIYSLVQTPKEDDK